MTIKNKDGTPFRLQSPNPLTKEQVHEEDWILHNFNWEPIPTDEKEIAPPTPPSLGVVESPPIPEPEPPKPEPIPVLNRAEEQSRNLKNIVIFHCLPTDTTGAYLPKFDFEGIFVLQEDLETGFWTNISINPGSIVYPSRLAENNKKFQDYRWWKVDRCIPKGKGFLIHAIISDVCPDFTDS
jgi:hypothetical protein